MTFHTPSKGIAPPERPTPSMVPLTDHQRRTRCIEGLAESAQRFVALLERIELLLAASVAKEQSR